MTYKHNLLQLAIAFDQFCNVLLGMALEPKKEHWGDETLSARAYRERDSKPWLYKLINVLFFWQKDHCKESYESELMRNHLPKELRGCNHG